MKLCKICNKPSRKPTAKYCSHCHKEIRREYDMIVAGAWKAAIRQVSETHSMELLGIELDKKTKEGGGNEKTMSA